MNYDLFIDKWNDLANEDKINCFNEFAREYAIGEEIFCFDEEFFETFFSSTIDAVRAVFFGKINSWLDEYIRFNGYGNLVSLSDYEAIEYVNEYAEEIFEHEEIWSQYIEEN